MTLTVCLDPGHGGKDTGAVYPQANPTHVEADIALELALATEAALAQLDWPVACVLTRDAEDDPPFAERAMVAAKAGADLVISVHCNASADHARGLMCFTRRDDAVGREIAADIMRAAPRPLLRSSLSPIDAVPDGWTGRAFNVLNRYEARPAVLVEAGFLTNEGDRATLGTAAGRDAVVAALLVGIARLRLMHPHG